MSNLIQHSFEGHEVRSQVDERGNPWFVAKDVCEVLGIAQTHKALNRVHEDDRTTVPLIDGLGRQQEMHVVNESGMYMLIFASRKEQSMRFKRWVTSEVLPAIRKTGTYSAAEPAPLKLIPEASAVFLSLVPVAEKFGLVGNQALLSAAQATRHVTSVDLPQLLGTTHLLAEKQVRHFTATELGQRLGLSAIAFNKMLEARGLQEKRDGAWCSTESGKAFAVLLDTGKKHGNGTPVLQLKWTEDVLETLQSIPA